MTSRSEDRIVQVEIDIKRWLVQVPSVDEVRPRRCPCCGAAGRPARGGLGLHGHGLRERQLRGPREPGAPPAIVGLLSRRYLCRRCGAVIAVMPRGLLRGRLFTAAAIGWALALFALVGLGVAEVRGRVSPWQIVGTSAAAGWAQFRRWIRASRSGALFGAVRASPQRFTPHQVAERAATTLAALAPIDAQALALDVRSFLGAARA